MVALGSWKRAMDQAELNNLIARIIAGDTSLFDAIVHSYHDDVMLQADGHPA